MAILNWGNNFHILIAIGTADGYSFLRAKISGENERNKKAVKGEILVFSKIRMLFLVCILTTAINWKTCWKLCHTGSRAECPYHMHSSDSASSPSYSLPLQEHAYSGRRTEKVGTATGLSVTTMLSHCH